MIKQILEAIKDILKNNTAVLFLLILLGIVLCISGASGKVPWLMNGETIGGPWRILLFIIGIVIFAPSMYLLYMIIKLLLTSEPTPPTPPTPELLCHTCYGLEKETRKIDYKDIGDLGEIYQNFRLTPTEVGSIKHCCYVQYLWADPGIGEDGGGYIKCQHYEKGDDNFLKVEFQNTKMEYSNVAIRPREKPTNKFRAFEIRGIENYKIVIIARISPEAWDDDKYSKNIDIRLRLVNGYHEHVEACPIGFRVAGVPNQITAPIQPNQVARKSPWNVLEFDFFNEEKYDLKVFPADGNIHRLGAGNKVPTKDMSIISSMVLTFAIKEKQFPEKFLGLVDIKQIRIVNRNKFDVAAVNTLTQRFNK